MLYKPPPPPPKSSWISKQALFHCYRWKKCVNIWYLVHFLFLFCWKHIVDSYSMCLLSDLLLSPHLMFVFWVSTLQQLLLWYDSTGRHTVNNVPNQSHRNNSSQTNQIRSKLTTQPITALKCSHEKGGPMGRSPETKARPEKLGRYKRDT